MAAEYWRGASDGVREWMAAFAWRRRASACSAARASSRRAEKWAL